MTQNRPDWGLFGCLIQLQAIAPIKQFSKEDLLADASDAKIGAIFLKVVQKRGGFMACAS